MAHVAREMEREGFKVPLLIGGATTSRIHTCVKIAPYYTGPTVHVLDASRSVNVASNLMNTAPRDAYILKTADEYSKSHEQHLSTPPTKPNDRHDKHRQTTTPTASEEH